MSYVALATDHFDDVVRFYGTSLGFSVVEQWDRPNGRGLRFDLGGLRLEILDNEREQQPLRLGEPADRFHVVVEVDNIDLAWRRIQVEAPKPQATSWGARLFRLNDPDGVPVTFLQWTERGSEEP
jgi:catechol 2,3-dioxygenase-like lactoylglutathione lyase family enzyme